ncbi:Hpt domain-containing protein [Ferrimonas aestuarii]|uniref:Hpt domain-containing protein n=1 Tax=Ferrimonas aestuarii TaxID=2569539 RepID=A0A4U1BRS7_9GAMM|nr:Hpt domain-containing protein [Ferrimonas aestuarii]TKB57303.1 Hpt domain-containing protein [Ferrimonas aestuarii]
MAVILNETCIDNLAADAGEDLLGELITVFIDEMEHRQEQVREANVMGQYQELAHSIKGSALTFGADALAEIAKEIEHRSKDQDQEVTAKLPELELCLKQTREQYQNYLNKLP